MSDSLLIKKLNDSARIGILNRGEAALRFIRAVREYNDLHGTNLQTVAFYIDKEEYAPFVKMSDDSLALSALPAYPGKQKSPYLDHELMLDALRAKNCEAIWVGWGFVSEDAIFAEKIEKEGIVFMGPSSKAMADLGDKITAKDIAEKADVPILPWSKKSVESIEEARKISEEIGYPVIVKASNAGGGRGIRFVRTPEELEPQFTSAREETIRITGNDIVFIEALVEKGRHLEVQCLADAYGTVNTFGVRDCSVQRKNQKIIEETPPPHLDPQMMKGMEEAAQRLLLAAKYVGAGTVEYLYDLNREKYFFMEVNTRLQVEHPITETLFSIDLVKGQIDVARDLKVDLSDRTPNGCVIEVRLNAEDPDRDFNPAPGKVELFKAPAGPGIRVDSGIEQGSDIPSEFDSMVAKVISAGANRKETISRLKRALKELRIRIENGTTNRAFLLELLNLPEINEGGVHTAFVEELLLERKERQDQEKIELALMAGAVEFYLKHDSESLCNFQEQLNRTGRPRNLPKAQGYDVNLSTLGNSYGFVVRNVGNNVYHLDIEGKELVCKYEQIDQESILTVNGDRHNILMVPRGDVLQCEVDGYPVILESESGGYVSSPSPAVILSVNVELNQEVKKGDVLLVLEAMKMEMLVEAPADGVVKEICVIAGSQVAGGQALVQLEMGDQEEEEVEEAAPPVEFSSIPSHKETKWDQLRNNFLANFLGYDSSTKGTEGFNEFLQFGKENEQFISSLVDALISSLSQYLRIEKLFTPWEVESNSFSRPVTYQELLTHYFRRSEDKEKGLPEEFLKVLEAAISCYPSTISENQAIYNIFKSHSSLAYKQNLVKQILFALEGLPVAREKHQELSLIIVEMVRLCQTTNPSVADAAIHARYKIIDIVALEEIKAKHHKMIEEMVSSIAESKKIDKSVSTVIDAGPYIQHELINLCASSDSALSEMGLKILAKRQCRDREIISYNTVSLGNDTLVKVNSKSGDQGITSLFAFVPVEELQKELPVQAWLDGVTCDENTEVVVMVYAEGSSTSFDEIFDQVKLGEFNAQWLSIGIFNDVKKHTYRTFDSNKEEILLRRAFSPLQFRELRVERLSQFNMKVLYENDGVFLLEATSKTNPKDIRLFGMADVSEVEPELTADDDINRLVLFETQLMEAVYMMHATQAKYRYRLEWNRLVMYNRTLLGIRTKQLEQYGNRLMNRIRDLGLEKLVVYTRRKRWSEEVVREIELNFMSVTQDQFSLRMRTPSTKPLETLDHYVTKVVKARQRKTVYPYEIIKMLTTAGFSKDESTPKGEFEEYDIKFDEGSTTQTYYSVKDREPGQNKSNIVFGMITNTDETFPAPLKRVIILADPTRDLGSLAEAECRRINAALDLAEEQQLPVEWIPISSGAKINMDSGTENLDWTARTVRRIIEFTQAGGEINIIVAGINVGAQSYWNAEATMLMHCRGLLIQTDEGSMLLTGKKALDFAGAVSGETNLDIGGVDKIMAPNGQAQVRVPNLSAAYQVLFKHYKYTYVPAGETYPLRRKSEDPVNRDVTKEPYNDFLDQGFSTIGDIFSAEKNGERKKPFDIRQVMSSLIDKDADYLERWRSMKDADTSIVWETQVGGYPIGMIGIESRNLNRVGSIPADGPEAWNGGTLFPKSSKKVARGINSFSGHLPLVIVANLSGFDGSPESLRRVQLEFGAEIGRAITNFKGPISFIVVARYHGGAYVVFSKSLNPNLRAAAVEGSYASVIGGAPAAAVVFPKDVLKETYGDPRITEMQTKLKKGECTNKEYDDLFNQVNNEKQAELGGRFDKIHSVERAQKVGSIDDIITAKDLRPYIVKVVEEGIAKK